mmetsp:Transcript_27147/g.42455  ORF Transcript_27147/g.42455 Transcript_27147/m.42455 type:complete len:110 (+) Transcript_27147:2324-2653(+)
MLKPELKPLNSKPTTSKPTKLHTRLSWGGCGMKSFAPPRLRARGLEGSEEPTSLTNHRTQDSSGSLESWGLGCTVWASGLRFRDQGTGLGWERETNICSAVPSIQQIRD